MLCWPRRRSAGVRQEAFAKCEEFDVFIKVINAVGVAGETQLSDVGAINRLYLYPSEGSYWFESYSIAATLYSIYGITNPEYLADGFGPIGANLLV